MKITSTGGIDKVPASCWMIIPHHATERKSMACDCWVKHGEPFVKQTNIIDVNKIKQIDK